MGSRRVPPPSLSRRAPAQVRSFKLTVHAVMEGENTEAGWLDYLKQRSCALSVQVKYEGGKGVPRTITALSVDLRQKINRQKSSPDEVWAVFDRDEHPHVRESIAACKDAGVGVAFSNACFELWPLLFCQEVSHNRDRHDLQSTLKGHHPHYDHQRGAHVNWPKFQPNLELATARALKLHKAAARHTQNGEDLLSLPFTTAWMLHHRLLLGDDFVPWLAETLRPTPALHELVTYLPTPLRGQVTAALTPARPPPGPN